MKIPIICINLERATRRRKKIEKLWVNNLGFDIQFWKAWDRRDIENGKFYFKYDAQLTQNTIKRQLNSGEIACATSHCMVYEYAINLKLDYCIVMEDDILPSKTTNIESLDRIVRVVQQLPNANIVLLHEIYNRINTIPTISETQDFKILEKWPFGNQMTFFTKYGLQAMYNNLHTLNYMADHWNIFPHSNPKKDICIIKKPLGYHEYRDSQDASTYIGKRSDYYSNYIE